MRRMPPIRVAAFALAPWLIAVAASTAVRERPQSASSDDGARPGRADFIEMGCYQCHGYEGQGDRATGPKLAPDPLPYDVFANWVRHPPDVMPAYSPNILSDEQLERIHGYLASIPAPPDPSMLDAFLEN